MGILKNFKPDTFDYPPDTWNKEEISLFDMLYDLEDRLKKQVVEVIQTKPSK